MLKRRMLTLYIGVAFVVLGLVMTGGIVVAQDTQPEDPCEALRTIPATSDSMSMEATPEAMAGEGESEEMGGHMLPSFVGDPGPALELVGDPVAGAQILADNCQKCHGEEGTGGVANPGSEEATIPSLNPLDEDMFDPDPMVYVCILDLFVEHGSVPGGTPQETMPAWGDEGKLDPQQIADVLAYVVSVNVARPSFAGDPGPAVDLVGDPEAGAQIFVDNCQKCHGENGEGGVDNPGSDDGTVPELNPIDPTLISLDHTTYVTNLDLYVEHGSMPGGTPQESMPAWGDEGKLDPQQIADVLAYVVSVNVARPSFAGDPGPAVDLVGDPEAGAQIFVDNCQKCHGENGTGGVDNPGSEDGTVPELNPIDPTLISLDHTTYVTNLDLFLEHGSVPEGTNPEQTMPAWGDEAKLEPQQIADVIAYVISLNQPDQTSGE